MCYLESVSITGVVNNLIAMRTTGSDKAVFKIGSAQHGGFVSWCGLTSSMSSRVLQQRAVLSYYVL